MKLLFLIPFGVAVLLAIIGVFLIRFHEQKLVLYTHETDALITDMRRRGTYYHPVFEYDYGGQHYRKVSTVGTSPPLYQTGQAVKIKLNPENPEKFTVMSGKMTNFASLILFCIAGVFCLSALIMLIVLP